MSLDIVVWREHFDDYADTAALLAVWDTEADPNNTATWTLDATHTMGSAACPRMSRSGDTEAGQVFSLSRTVGSDDGLEPNTTYQLHRTVWREGTVAAGVITDAWDTETASVTTDATGAASIGMTFTITQATTATTADKWFGVLTLTKTCSAWFITDLLLDVGTVQLGETLLGYTVGGLDIEELDEWDALDYPGKTGPLVGGDLKRTTGLRVSFDLLSVANTVQTLMPGGTTEAGTGQVQTRYIPSDAGAILGSGGYLTDLICRWPYHCGGFLQWRLPTAKVVSAPVTARDKQAVTRRVTIEARRTAAEYLSDTGAANWMIELVDAVS